MLANVGTGARGNGNDLLRPWNWSEPTARRLDDRVEITHVVTTLPIPERDRDARGERPLHVARGRELDYVALSA
jgi:hypothetical protein